MFWDGCGRSVLSFLAEIYGRMETYNSRGYSGLNSQQSLFFFSFLPRDHWPDSNARADNTPHPCHGSITSRNDVEIGLYTIRATNLPLPCCCAHVLRLYILSIGSSQNVMNAFGVNLQPAQRIPDSLVHICVLYFK